MADKGLKVVIDDLKTLADNFDQEGREYGGLADKLQPKSKPDSGDGELDQTIDGLIVILGNLHQFMTKSIQEHSRLMDHAYKAYADQEIDNRELFDDLDPDRSENTSVWKNPDDKGNW